MTITAPDQTEAGATPSSVYLPQQDSRLLIATLQRAVPVAGRSVLDLCTGSGVVAIAAARLGASVVQAWDICPEAVRHSRREVAAAGVEVEVRLGSWPESIGRRRFDVVVANPPYVPVGPDQVPVEGPAMAWDAGTDGRSVIDPLCAAAPRLLAPGGSLLFVQSAFTGVEKSLSALRASRLSAAVVARQRIPFGPVLTSRARWLERTGLAPVGCREEELVVIRADL